MTHYCTTLNRAATVRERKTNRLVIEDRFLTGAALPNCNHPLSSFAIVLNARQRPPVV